MRRSKHRRSCGRWPGLLALVAATGVITTAQAATFRYSLATGAHLISLPVTSPAINNCGDLLALIPNVTDVLRFDSECDSFISCGACPGSGCFGILPGEAYRVQVSAPSNFNITNGADGGVVLTLIRPGPGSLTGTHAISLPFGSPLRTSLDLVNSMGGFFATSGGTVVHVQRLLLGGGLQTYSDGVPFDLEVGEGYLVRMHSSVAYTAPSFNGDFCDTSTTCFFEGLEHTAFGTATMALNQSGDLVVDGLVAPTNTNFVRVANPGLPFSRGQMELRRLLGDKDPWIPLGVLTTRSLNLPATTTGDAVATRSSASFMVAGALRGGTVSVDVAQISASQVEITSDFSATGATQFTYEVYNNPGMVLVHQVVLGVGAVQATAWPIRHAFTVIQWPESPNVMITLPTTPTPTTVSGDLLRIIPQATAPGAVQHYDFGAAGVSLDNLDVAEGAFPQSTDPLPPLPPPATFLLTVGKGPGGTVTSSPPGTSGGISCGAGCSQDIEAYVVNAGMPTQVTLTATPTFGLFTRWSGDCSGSANTAFVTMAGPRYCTVTFTSAAPIGARPGLSSPGLALLVVIMLALLAWAARRDSAGGTTQRGPA